jgi:hypothetical protein
MEVGMRDYETLFKCANIILRYRGEVIEAQDQCIDAQRAFIDKLQKDKEILEERLKEEQQYSNNLDETLKQIKEN